jgi:cobalamin biosynthesis protein CobD/CbiB
MRDRDRPAESARSQRRADSSGLGAICLAVVVAEIMVVAVMPPHARYIMAGLLAMVTAVPLLAVAMDGRSKQAERAERVAKAGAANPLRRPRERVSLLVQRAYYLARDDQSASFIAGSCDIPEAFAALIVDDVRRTPSR